MSDIWTGTASSSIYGEQPYLDVTVTQSATKYTFLIKFGIRPTKSAIPSGFTAKGKLTGNVEWKTYSKTTTATVAQNTYYQLGSITIERERYASASRTFEINWEGALVGVTTDGRSIMSPASHTYTIPALPTYTITLKKNDGTTSNFTTQTKTHGQTLTLTSNKPTRTNYTFVSWNTNSSGTGTNYASGGSFTANANTTLYAKWTPATYTITYNKNTTDTVTSIPANQTKVHGTSLKLSSTKPTRTNYAFIKWNTNANGTGTDYEAGANYTANSAVTLYAVWQSLYTPPQINNLTAYRVDTNGIQNEEGEYSKVDFTWVAGSENNNPVTPQEIIIKWKRTIDTEYVYSVSITDSNILSQPNISVIIGETGSTLSTEFQYDIQVILVPNNGKSNIVRTTYISIASFIIDINTEGDAVGIGMVAPDETNGSSELHVASDSYFYNPIYIKNITTIYDTKTTASSTQSEYTYVSIPALAKYNIVAIRAEVRNIRQILYFIRPFGNTPQMIMDMSDTTYIRGQFLIDWTNNRIGIRWVNGTSSFASSIFFQQVYGIA